MVYSCEMSQENFTETGECLEQTVGVTYGECDSIQAAANGWKRDYQEQRIGSPEAAGC